MPEFYELNSENQKSPETIFNQLDQITQILAAEFSTFRGFAERDVQDGYLEDLDITAEQKEEALAKLLASELVDTRIVDGKTHVRIKPEYRMWLYEKLKEIE